ncbi:MAG: lysophospholipid acyltransferase family protein [Desulfobacteraceae bacterium]|nr:lysophospholipid acyltransferase family protein [Desulfobacteraceae bacterium]
MSDEHIYKLIKLLIKIVGKVPKSVLDFVSDGIGIVWYKVDARHRKVVIDNVQSAYPKKYSDSQARSFARKNFKHISGILFELIWSYSKKKEELKKFFTIKGLEYFKAGKDKGRGVILLTCHMGNFELMVPAFSKVDDHAYILYRQLDFKPLDRIVSELRQRFGFSVIPIRNASQKVIKILRDGGNVGTLLDQNVDWYKGVFVDYFGRPACTNNGLAKLVMNAKAVVIPMFIMKKERKFVFEIFPEIPIQITGDTIKDIEKNTQNFVSAIEIMVRKCPEQYFWVHNRWKTKPYCLLNTK